MKVLIRLTGASCFCNFDAQSTSAVYAADVDDAASSLEEAMTEWVKNLLKSYSIEFCSELNWEKEDNNLLATHLPEGCYPFEYVEVFHVRSFEDLTGKIFEEDGWDD